MKILNLLKLRKKGFVIFTLLVIALGMMETTSPVKASHEDFPGPEWFDSFGNFRFDLYRSSHGHPAFDNFGNFREDLYRSSHGHPAYDSFGNFREDLYRSSHGHPAFDSFGNFRYDLYR